MKKIILKVCVLGLIGLAIFTGCNNSNKVKKIKKNEEVIQYNEDDKEYYSVEYYKYKENSGLKNEYNDEITALKNREEVSNIDVITNDKNVYEAIFTLKSEYLNGVYYDYVLFVKNKTEFVSVFQSSKNKDKSNMKNIGNEIKEKLFSTKDYRKVFDNYAKENNLIVTKEGFTKSSFEEYGCVTALNASNSTIVTYNGSNKEVKKVEIEEIDLAAEKLKLFVAARNSDNQIIWTFDIGVIPKGIGLGTLNLEQCDKYVYYTFGEGLEARDIQTGKIVWKRDFKSSLFASNIVEHDGKVYVEYITEGYTLEILDIQNGKSLFYLNNIDSVIGKPKDNMRYDFQPYTMKVEGNIVTFEVNLNDDGGNYVKKAGYLKVNTENSKVNFELIK